MAGSLSHIVDDEGHFTMDLIENLGDAHEALEECFHVIRRLTEHDPTLLDRVCSELGYPIVEPAPLAPK